MIKYIYKDGEKFKIYKEVSSTTVTFNEVPIRYVRDWLSGSTANTGNHWVEIQAINSRGTNIALNKTVVANNTLESGQQIGWIVNNSTDSSQYVGVSPLTDGSAHIIIDLGSPQQVTSIKVWHYFADGRTYRKTKTEVSEDGITWHTLFNSATAGEYAENSSGKTHLMSSISKIVKIYGVEELANATAATFVASGMNEDLMKIGLIKNTFESNSIKVLTYSDELAHSKKLKLTGTDSRMQILKMNYDFNMSATNITGIKSSLIEFVKDNSLDNIRIIFSLDSGATWKSINSSALVDVNINSEQDILDKGLTEAKFNSLVQAELDLLYSSTKKIRYAICLKEKDMDKVLSISKLKVLYK